MKKYYLLFLCAITAACGAFDESPETLAIEANQKLTCNMSPQGKWGAYSDPMFGTCGYLAPFWAFVDEQGELYVEESANCERINEELNLEVSMHFFLQNRSNAHPRYEGNINLEIKTLDTEESLCSGTYEVRVLYHNEG